MKTLISRSEIDRAEVISKLAEAMELAEKNKSTQCAVVLLNDQHDITSCWFTAKSTLTLTGALTSVQYDMLKAGYPEEVFE